MNNTIIKSLALVLTAACIGCTDLEERPVGLLAPESLFNTSRDVEIAIFGAYGWIASERLYGRQFVTAIMLRSDMVDIGDRGTPAERQQVNDFNMDDNNGMVNQFWPYWYQVISAANAGIAGAEIVDMDADMKNRLVAEARFIRGFSYFHLVRNFGDIPYIDYFIDDPQSVKDISKTPTAQVYAGILADLEFAKQYLPDQQPNNIRSRPTKGTAASYLATVHLTLQDYAKAHEEAKWVIDNRGRFGYELENDFQDLFRAELANNMREHIFAVEFLGQQSGGGGANDDLMAAMTGIRGADELGWSVCVPSMNVFNTWDDRDYRKAVSFAHEAPVGGVMAPYTQFQNTQRPHIAKYRRYPGNSNAEGRYSDHNYAAMRFAEVLLTAAEAAAEVNNGPTAEAIGYVNEVRARARNAAGVQGTFPEDVPTGLSKEDFINLVLDERRLELAFEYKRWYDIQRRNLGDVVFKGANSLEPHANFDANRDYLMPLPRIELDVNPNLLPQNPGY
ncbi:MAG: RagB/SusD family nutrient uptake outer membrane protein [Lunatimonas sp.]|uniref:RagB/SusD family nutrient uptake outer membrane protein n=1 Tax=Lunatimonas sp. TaxID=2060141 RepID=UPI00263A3DF3|nr:RagB/SusD family nutrient uptake outer membrane protein [Lunatimonas sp.]MCC5938819.1 RagB/SusD family nutrient uptake outer membrane protein [Lunatimonas sp.]